MDLIKLIAVVVIIGAIAIWLIRYFEVPQPFQKYLIAAVVIILGIFFLNGIGLSLPNVL